MEKREEMESRAKEKLKILIAVASVAFVTAFFAARAWRRRKQRRSSVSCYLHAEQKLKPQYSFQRVLADNSYSPFEHLKIGEFGDEHKSTPHPYGAEIMRLLDASQLDFEFVSDKKELKRIDSFVWVEEEQQLKELADLLCQEKAFAVDTEQHSFRSFLGFTALMQISTQKENYLIDTIKLHDTMEILRPAFSDPRICKVFHGADNDVLWLQRDFHIYVVNLFDTAKACDLLSKPQRSLAYLLESYCGITTNKMLQREDWRQRPLPEEMARYARIDAQYLLYIANRLVSELNKRDQESSPDDGLRFVLEAYRRSNVMCLQLYSKDSDASPGEAAASSIIARHMHGQGGETDAHKVQDVIQRLCVWREVMARVHDESLRYVLSDQAIVAFAEKTPVYSSDVCDTIIQAEMNADLINSCMPVPSPLIDSHVDDIFHLFSKIGSIDEIFHEILQNCFGQNGTCPLSIFSYGIFLNSTVRLNCKSLSRQSGTTNLKQASRQASRELFVRKFSCKSPVYHNCRILANDGRLLCYCDRRKLEWYLCRNLAKIVEEDPPAIMLLFEPKGRPEDEDNEFYIQSKKNICVGCGEGNHYLRYRIIPSCYRMHFPEHLKSHRSHDIVLLCVDCHEIAHAAAEKYKRKVAKEFGIPLFVRNIVDLREIQVSSDSSELFINFEKTGVSPLELRTAAMALIRHGQKMPSSRRKELREVVKRFYGGRDISDDDLQKALLVGMSSHERKRFEKGGLASKHFKCDNDKDEMRTRGNASREISSHVNTAEACELDGSFTMIEEYGDYTNKILSTCSQNKGIATAEGSNPCSVADTGRLSPNKVVNMTDVERKADSDPPKNNSKISLLGHGPHGKQVVEHILQEQAEDGISLFCQLWRQVFVEAVHPRFLPAGWDVKHSGRRDFGEYSVYNSSRKAYAAAS